VTGVAITEVYGLSESTGAALANPVTKQDFDGSVGVPLPSVEAEIRGEDGVPVPLGTPGELFLRGPIIMRGYFKKLEETAACLGADGFFATGDIATMAADGTVRIIDRKKDMILVSGFNVYPTELEGVLVGHPGIAEVAVVGVADSTSGETPVAFVVRRDPTLTAEQVIAFARENLTGYKIPRRVEFLADLPKSPVGKVLRKNLRASLG
jgi:long-chain acyl-CoA synthetase